MGISDAIERFIKALMEDTDSHIELKRNELAQYFSCAPSQINYVLATRFTPDHGYLIESRRGGGGYIRIIRAETSTDDHLDYVLKESIGDSITTLKSNQLIRSLFDRQILSADEARLMTAAISQSALSLPIPGDMKNELRARLLKSMLLALTHSHNPFK